MNAYRGDAGEQVIEEHTEEGSDHEEMYVVLHGHARFTLDGEDVDAPAGTVVFLPDPPTLRVARAEADGTVVLALGGKPGTPYETSAWEWRFRAAPHRARGRARAGRGDPARGPRRASRRRRHALQPRLRRTRSPGATRRPPSACAPPSSARPEARGWALEDPDLATLRERPEWPL